MPLSLAVVGHTNTGKTSLMRTLLRDGMFGEVCNAAATTRHVEEAVIAEGKRPLVKLYDTPGLEDASGIWDWLETETSNRRDGVERIRIFLNSSAAQHEFSQEAKVLRQLLDSDVALYVIDAREPVLSKYKDELTILSWCAKPLMPVFNFTQGQDLSAWQMMLARRNLHVVCGFDTVAFDFEGEMRLWESLATMLPSREVLDKLIAFRRREWTDLDEQARLNIAHFLLDIAAYVRTSNDTDDLTQIQATMQAAVRESEQNLHRQLLTSYRFYHNDVHGDEWSLQAFRQDPFDGNMLKYYGIRTTQAAATGALIGLGIDALTFGVSLGLGAAVGGVIGGLFSNWQTLSDKIQGVHTVRIDNPTLTVLAARQLDLLSVLQTRGHAAQNGIIASARCTPWSPEKLPEELEEARRYGKWSVLNGVDEATAETARDDAARKLSQQLHFPLSHV